MTVLLEAEGPGGGGGGGYIAGPTGIAALLGQGAPVIGGIGGTSTSLGVVSFRTNGATAGHVGTVAESVVPGVAGPICAPADLSITASDGVAALLPGASTNYVVTVTNIGPMPVQNAQVTSKVNQNLASQSWTCVVASGDPNTTRCDDPRGNGALTTTASLAPGAKITYFVAAALPQAAVGTLDFSATVTVPDGITDPDLTNNTATDSDVIGTAADLAVQIASNPGPLYAGTPIPFAITVNNLGPSDAVNASLAIKLPAQSVLTDAPGNDGWQCVQQDQSLTCQRQGLGKGLSTVLNLTLLPDLSLTSITLAATVAATTPDPDLSNNSAGITLAFVPQRPTLNGGGFGCSVASQQAAGPGALGVGLWLWLGFMLALNRWLSFLSRRHPKGDPARN